MNGVERDYLKEAFDDLKKDVKALDEKLDFIIGSGLPRRVEILEAWKEKITWGMTSAILVGLAGLSLKFFGLI